MDTKMRAKVLAMATAALGFGMVGCGKKAEPTTVSEGTDTSSGAEAAEAASETAEPAAEEGAAEGGGESSCGGASCGSADK